MAVKRFYAVDMRTALNNIRNQLGPDAVILATRQLTDGVEVSAAAESLDPRENAQKKQASPAASQSNLESTTEDKNHSRDHRDAWMPNSISAIEEEHSVLYSELGSIRSLLQHWMDTQGWENYATKSPLHAKLWERYRSLGLDGERINQLLKTVSQHQDLKEAWQLSLCDLTRQLPVIENDMIEAGGLFAFIGATGVGKTTTLGKLATRYVLNHGAESVALVTTDRYRIAAHEQLRTLGKILGVSVQAVDDSNTLGAVLESLRGKSLVLIDTAGINIAHQNFDDQLELLQNVSSKIKSILVLAATSQQEVQLAEIRAYSKLNPTAAIITKTDEAVSLGESLGLLISNQLPAAYVTDGQSIPDDIAVADAQQLVNKAVLISRHKPINKEQMLAGFNAAFTNTGPMETHAANVS